MRTLMISAALLTSLMATSAIAQTNWDGPRSGGTVPIDAVLGGQNVGGAPLTEQNPSGQTLDDLFDAVAKQVPEFGGMFFTNGVNECVNRSTTASQSATSSTLVLCLYLTKINSGRLTAVRKAIMNVFGEDVIPQGGIQPLRGEFQFSQLREWYTRMMGPVFRIRGTTLTDIDEANNRLLIGVETNDIEADVVEQLQKLAIPRRAVVIQLISVTTGRSDLQRVSDQPGSGQQPAALTLQDRFRPTEGGFRVDSSLDPALNETTACTLGFNATRAGGKSGFVTSTDCTGQAWQLDGAFFVQGPPFSANLLGREAVDPTGFRGFNIFDSCPKYQVCRYSNSVFIDYYQGISSSQGVVARTTALTTTSTPNITVDPSTKFGIASGPSQPYLVGLTLNKVGQATGWTSGQVANTCATFYQPGLGLYLCQYIVGNSTITDPNWSIADISENGAPVFRMRNFRFKGWEHVELYGMVMGSIGWPAAKAFVFSPIGGSRFQQTGIQSPTELGPLDYTDCSLPPGIPTC
jgi:hypothetical protein